MVFAILVQTVRADTATAPAPELLSNHDFSSAKKDPAFPDEWHRKPWMTWESEQGFHFLRQATATPQKDISAWRQVSLPPGLKAVQVSVRYRTSGVKLDNTKDAGVRGSFVFLDAVQIKFAPSPAPLALSPAADKWTTATAKIAVPEDATSLWLNVGMFGVQAGQLDLADVAITPLPSDELPAQPTVADTNTVEGVPIRRDGPRTIIGYGEPTVWFIHPYVDVLGHDYDMGIRHLVQEAHEKGHPLAIGVATRLEDVSQDDAKDLTFVFSYKNINYPLPAQARRLIFLNTWLLPEVKWPESPARKNDVVLLGARTLHNDGDGLATNKDRWWQIQKNDPALTLTVLDNTGYFLPMSVWRSAVYKLIVPDAPTKS
ncbi:MAG TPA: hypothetical protein VHY09_14090 [Candidatus Methylacidiphilales bacterium]|nr:hypothetical protein [Candidatus Methylacidiphilales bacterium]